MDEIYFLLVERHLTEASFSINYLINFGINSKIFTLSHDKCDSSAQELPDPNQSLSFPVLPFPYKCQDPACMPITGSLLSQKKVNTVM